MGSKKRIVSFRLSEEDYASFEEAWKELGFKCEGDFLRFLIREDFSRIPAVSEKTERLRLSVGRLESRVTAVLKGSAGRALSENEKEEIVELLGLISGLLRKDLEETEKLIWQSQNSAT
jgi:uncharacterized lipoprotein